MSRSASLNDLAKRELREATAHYEAQAPGLGKAFVETVERETDRLLEFPESAPFLRSPVRGKSLPRFPYTLIYQLQEDEVRILAVMHQSRRPLYWLGRS